MSLFTSFQQWLENTEPAVQRRYLLVALAILIGCSVLFWIIIHHMLSTYDTRLQTLHKRRQEVAALLARNVITQQHKEHVSALVTKDDQYKISQLFEDILKQNDMIQNRVSEPKTTSQEVLDTYIEWTLSVELTALSMKKVVDLLYAIEKEERMYTKHLELEKTQSGKFVTMHLRIATLEPNTVPTE